MDVWYVDNQSLFFDLKILSLTVWAVLARRGISAHGDRPCRNLGVIRDENACYSRSEWSWSRVADTALSCGWDDVVFFDDACLKLHEIDLYSTW